MQGRTGFAQQLRDIGYRTGATKLICRQALSGFFFYHQEQREMRQAVPLRQLRQGAMTIDTFNRYKQYLRHDLADYRDAFIHGLFPAAILAV